MENKFNFLISYLKCPCFSKKPKEASNENEMNNRDNNIINKVLIDSAFSNENSVEFRNKERKEIPPSETTNRTETLRITDKTHDQTLDDQILNAFYSAPVLKLTLLGDGGVGKSCLILQYMYYDFEHEYEPTNPSAYRNTIMLEGEEVQYNIVDTAGQEDYAVQEGYIKNSDGFLLVFDLTNHETFESVKKHRENLLRLKVNDEIVVTLVGNKSDLVDDRKVKAYEAEELANSFNVPYIETSALTRDNVDKAFSETLIRIRNCKTKSFPSKTSSTQQTPSNIIVSAISESEKQDDKRSSVFNKVLKTMKI